MRIAEKYERFGYFWLPEADSKKIPGTLIISDGGKISLHLNGTFDDGLFANDSPERFDRIVGTLKSDGLVTLDDCFYTDKSVSLGSHAIGQSSLHVHRALIGVSNQEDKEIRFNEFSFSIEGLDEWMGVSGLTVDYGKDMYDVRILYNRPTEIRLAIRTGMELRIGFAYTPPSLPTLKEAKLTQRVYFTLRSDQELLLKEFIDVTHKIVTFLCFAIDETVSLKEVRAASDHIKQQFDEETSYPVWARVFYASLPFAQDVPEASWYRMLFRYDHIKERAESVLNRWIDAWDMFGPSLGLYFSSVTGRKVTLDSRFLSLVQGLEVFHRRTTELSEMDGVEFDSLLGELLDACPLERKEWLRQRLAYANEVSLAKRLKSIITPYADRFGGNKKKSRLVRRIVDTRNYLTHFDRRLETQAATGKELLHLCYAMEVLFQMCLLETIGFTDAEVQRVIDGSYALKQKLALLEDGQ